jgi:CheY-like chemotaxis protein
MQYTDHKILIVEDEQDWREMVAERLVAEGYTVETADSYSEALERLRHRDIRLSIVDLRLVNPRDPENLDGLDVLRETLMWGSNAIVLTGLAPHPITRQMIYREYGVFQIVEKDRCDLEIFVKKTVAEAWQAERPEFQELTSGETLSKEAARRLIDRELGPTTIYATSGARSIGEQLRELRALAAQIRQAAAPMPDAEARLQQLNRQIAELEDRYLEEEGPMGLA